MDADWRDLEAIKRLKYRYMRCIDRKLWDELRDVFTPDATASYSSGKYAFTGRDAILEFLSKSMGSPRFLSSHTVHHPEIELTGPTTARGNWALEDTVHILDAGLTNTQAFAANAFFTAGLVLFEVPTGVVADLRGRRLSYLLGTLTLAYPTM